MRHKLLPILFSILLIGRFAFNVQAQAPALCSAAQVLTIGSCNVDFNINNTIAPTADSCASIFTGLRNGWARFTATSSAPVTIQYSNLSTTLDAAISIYQGSCTGGALVQCVNSLVGPGTEQVTINASKDTVYFIKISNLTDAAQILPGKICLQNGYGNQSDLCANAQEVTLNTCGLEIDITSALINQEGLAAPACVVGTVQLDAWVKFDAQLGQFIQLTYLSQDKNAAIAVYQGVCGNLNLLGCADAINGAGKERILFQVPSDGTYYLRLMNLEDTESLAANLCIREVRERDDCSLAATAPALNLGDCNVPLDVLASFGSVFTDDNGCASGNKDAWITYTATTDSSLRLDYASTNGGLPDLVVYENFTCGTTVAPIACAVNGGNSFTSLTFDAIAGRTYSIKVISSNGASVEGVICLYGQTKTGSDYFFQANLLDIDGSDCTIPLNVEPSFNAHGGAPLADPLNISCSGTSQADAWARFELPTSDTLIIEYDNTTNNLDEAQNVALVVYKGEKVDTVDFSSTPYIKDNCTALNLPADVTPGNTYIENITISNGIVADFTASGDYDSSCNPLFDTAEGDAWAVFQAQAGVPFTVVFTSASIGDIELEVYKGNNCAGLALISPTEAVSPNDLGCNKTQNLTEVSINPSGNDLYFIRMLKFTPGAFTGNLAILTALQELGCRDDIGEGKESFTLFENGTTTDQVYYIRIANISTGTLNGVTGNLCIRPPVEPRDLCSTADNFNNGGCSSAFNITTALDELEDIQEPACVDANGTRDILGDAWASFTATSNNYTIEYAHTGADIAIAIYKGSCGNLSLIACANTSAALNGLEKLRANTVEGLQYYVRIMSLDASTATGALCIRETEESDVCDINTIQRIFSGDCNIRLDVPADFTNNGAALRDVTAPGMLPSHYSTFVAPDFTCDPDTTNTGTPGTNMPRVPARDSWISMVGNGEVVTLQYQNNHDGVSEISDPAIVVYTALLDKGPIDCSVGINGAGNIGNEYACVDKVKTSSRQTESLTFLTSPGRQYLIRIMDMASSVTGMSGSLCLSDGEQDYTTCAQADTVSLGQCSIQINVTYDAACNLPGGAADCPGTSCQSDVWAVFQTPDSTGVPGTLPADNITVEYDNSGNSNDIFTEPADVALAIYRGTCGALTLVACVDNFGPGVEGIERINFNVAADGDETYYIRFINQTAGATAFGRLCLFYGKDIAQELCSTPAFIGDLDGEWKSFEVPSNWSTAIVPSADIQDPSCVIESSTSIPTTSFPLVKSQGWFQFEVPAGSTQSFSAVTIQYDNEDFVDGDPQNAALAVYTVPNGSAPNCGLLSSFNGTGAANAFANIADYSNPGGLFLLDCVNSVWEGTESLSLSIQDGRTYYVRIMNVSGSNPPENMPGRIRVFPFAPCQIGAELVKDGTFENWGAINDASSPATSSTNYADMDGWIHTNPRFRLYGTDKAVMNSYARFATDYGYISDQGEVTGINTQANLWAKRTEMRTEGIYSVTHTAWNYKKNWFCYGHGYSGYGGGLDESASSGVFANLDPNYCVSGPGASSEACLEDVINPTTGVFGTPQPGLPALIPTAEDANFMLINGWFPDENLYDPGKIWCQTIDRSPSSVGKVGYYIFSIWFQNVKSADQIGEVPQLRMTICDMADPTTGQIPPSSEWLTLTPQTGDSLLLPGITKTYSSIPNPDNSVPTVHIPEPPNSADMTIPAPRTSNSFAFGAAMPCNAAGEPNNARLKVLGSSFFLEQNPDQWQIIRCIYRAPADVEEFNICVENLSITKNGNDFAIDDISFRECEDPDVNAFENLLRGGGCELADSPEVIGPGANLRAEILDFSGKMIQNQVFLNWLTLLEDNLSHFEVQRSANGKDFTTIGEVNSYNNTSTLSEYNFVDQTFPRTVNYLYYRLKIVNKENKYRIGNVIRVAVNQSKEIPLQLIPNPVNRGDVATVKFTAATGYAGFILSDVMGHKIQHKIISTQEGDNTIELNTAVLPSGIYILKITLDNGQSFSGKLLII